LQKKVHVLEKKVKKGEETISFIESLVDKRVLYKDSKGNINYFEI